MSRTSHAWIVTVVMLASSTAIADAGTNPWPGYLDYAYVYSSAEPADLRVRLAEYARESGVTLHDYAAENLFGSKRATPSWLP